MRRFLCLSVALGSLLFAGTASAVPAGSVAPEPPAPLFHGHWCGLGDEKREAPVDALDAACRAHDLCYERRGRNACSCDKAFLKATGALIKNPRTDDALRNKAATANSLFSAAPCVESQKSRARAARP